MAPVFTVMKEMNAPEFTVLVVTDTKETISPESKAPE
jgi:hypothetical protein